MNQAYLDTLLEVGALPTAPFVEGAVGGYIRHFVETRGHLRLQEDRWGNLLVHYANPAGGRDSKPLWIAAHMDHPGFVAEKMTARNRLYARWFGGVRLELFKNADVRFYVVKRDGAGNEGSKGSPAGRPVVDRIVPGRVTRVVATQVNGEARPHLRKRPEAVYVEVAEPVPPGSPGMWYLPDPHVVKNMVMARAHDDLAQVAAMLCLLDELNRRRLRGQVTCAFTRAEECGFIGAIALARSGQLPRNLTFISLECSDAVAAGATPGEGAILRVGDLATTFDQPTLSWMQQVAKGLAGDDKQFRFQRKLMPGGSCEATPLAVFGYRTGALCLPLVNYHNMSKASRAQEEAIDWRDFENEVAWLVSLVERGADRSKANPIIAARLNKRFAAHRQFLKHWQR